MITYLRKRRARKLAKEWLHQARHARNLREDIAEPEALNALDRAVRELRETVAGRIDYHAVEKACNHVAVAVNKICPPRRFSWFRENAEIALVAVAVAMAFRTYFVQPFKIPTGSMQPTLYGIHYEPQTAPGWFDRAPLNMLRWIVFGEWYTEYHAQTSGIVSDAYRRQDDPDNIHVVIGGIPHALPRGIMEQFRFQSGDRVVHGQVVASGLRTLGDHIFVNRVRWNFIPPKRGDVMVFTTRDIPQIEMDTHYIKRMVGMPNETVGIKPPYLLINDEPMLEPEMIRRITLDTNHYMGYKTTGLDDQNNISILNTENDRLHLGPAQYAAFGDNTGSSLDSRYWGPVMQQNLVGPAFMVYWPISERWGWIH